MTRDYFQKRCKKIVTLARQKKIEQFVHTPCNLHQTSAVPTSGKGQ